MTDEAPRPTFTSFVVEIPTLLTSLEHAVEVLGAEEGAHLTPAFIGVAGLRGIWAVPHPEHAPPDPQGLGWRKRALVAEDAENTLREREGLYEERIAKATEIIENYGGIDGAHHKQWVLDQAIRALLGGSEEAYRIWHAGMTLGENEEYEWDEGIPP